MFKKIFLLWLLLMVFAGSLFAGGVDIVESENLRRNETNDEKFMRRLKSSEKYEAPLLEKVFPEVEFFIQRSSISKPNSIRLAGKYKDEFYPMPAQFNILYKLIEEKSKATIEERIEVFSRMLVVLPSTTRYLYKGELKEIGYVKVTEDTSYVDIVRYNYKIEMTIEGEKRKAYFWIGKNQIRRVRFESSTGLLHLISPAVITSFRDIDVNIPNISPEYFDNYENYYVAVSNGTGQATNNTVEFVISGLEPFHPNARLQIEPIYGYNDSLFLDTLLVVNESGNAEYEWTPSNNLQTGICDIIIRVNDVGENVIEGKKVIPEHTLTGTFDGGYDYTVYYTNQFFYEHPNGMSYASTFAGQTKNALTESWNKEINDWNLCQLPLPALSYPEDEDENYQVFINDAIDVTVNKYHSSFSTGYLFDFGQMIALGSYLHQRNDVYGNLTTYDPEQDLIYSAICHEFYHGIQNELMDGNTDVNNWMEEGQARFIQTVFMEQFATPGEEFETGRLYQQDANKYLLEQMNNSFSIIDYGYSLFWRFLFENYSSSPVLEDKLAIIRETCRGNTNPDISAIKTFMDSELNSNSGIYNSFDEALIAFAKNAYLNNPAYSLWNPCPSDSFYVTPAITASNRNGITNTFTGERNVTETDAIAEPFGIDYMIFSIGASVSNVCLNFDGDPDDDSDMADFYANALLMEGNDLISEQEIFLTNGKGVISFEPNDPVNKIVLIIARLDSDETRENDYEVILSDEEIHISGNVSGTWANTYSTYIIDGDITVSSGNTLIIEPGIKVNFSGHYKFNINGRLLAEGTADANIIFTAENQTTGWNGLHFINQNTNGQDSSKVVYCKLQYGRATDAYPNNCGGAIYLENSDILIDNCIISYNSAVRDGGGIYIYNSSSPTINNSLICNNSASYNGGGINIFNEDYNMCFPSFNNLTIVNNSTTNKGGGIYCEYWSHPTITNSTFYGNSASSGGGFYSQYLLNYINQPSLLNCILWNDTPSEIVASPITVTYSDIQGGFSGDGNIDANPLFADPANGDFQITWANYPENDVTKSPCIDTGNSSSPLDPDDTIADMGAFYFHQYETGLSAPEDVIVTIDADSVYITWSTARNRNTYKVYSSNDPYLDFTEDLTGTYNETSWTAPFPTADDKKFYYVTSSDEREQRSTYEIPKVKGK